MCVSTNDLSCCQYLPSRTQFVRAPLVIHFPLNVWWSKECILTGKQTRLTSSMTHFWPNMMHKPPLSFESHYGKCQTHVGSYFHWRERWNAFLENCTEKQIFCIVSCDYSRSKNQKNLFKSSSIFPVISWYAVVCVYIPRQKINSKQRIGKRLINKLSTHN